VLLVHRPTLSAFLFEDDLGWILHGRTSSVVSVFDPRGLTGRYLYLPGVGFALALGTLVPNAAARAAPMCLRLVTSAAVAFIAWRFAFFGYKTARDCRARTLPYETYVERSREQHRSPAPGALIEVPAPRADEPPARFLEDLLRVAYDDPTLRVVVEGQGRP
jgi:hypothetical protein